MPSRLYILGTMRASMIIAGIMFVIIGFGLVAYSSMMIETTSMPPLIDESAIIEPLSERTFSIFLRQGTYYSLIIETSNSVRVLLMDRENYDKYKSGEQYSTIVNRAVDNILNFSKLLLPSSSIYYLIIRNMCSEAVVVNVTLSEFYVQTTVADLAAGIYRFAMVVTGFVLVICGGVCMLIGVLPSRE